MRTKPIKELSIDQIADRLAIMDPVYRKYCDNDTFWLGDLLEEYTHPGIDSTFDDLEREFNKNPDFLVYREYCHRWLDTAKPFDKEDRSDVIAMANMVLSAWEIFWAEWFYLKTPHKSKVVSDSLDVRSVPKVVSKA